MATFLQTQDAIDVYTFTQFSGTVGALATALNAAVEPNIQTFADGVTAGNALVVVDGSQVFSVPPNYYVGLNKGVWEVLAAAKLAGGGNSTYTPYTPA